MGNPGLQFVCFQSQFQIHICVCAWKTSHLHGLHGFGCLQSQCQCRISWTSQLLTCIGDSKYGGLWHKVIVLISLKSEHSILTRGYYCRYTCNLPQFGWLWGRCRYIDHVLSVQGWFVWVSPMKKRVQYAVMKAWIVWISEQKKTSNTFLRRSWGDLLANRVRLKIDPGYLMVDGHDPH